MNSVVIIFQVVLYIPIYVIWKYDKKHYDASVADLFAENIVDLMYDCKPHGVFEKIELDERDLYLSDYVITKIEGKYRK